jgi:hypothetical protein
MDLENLRFERLCRTPHSEGYQLFDGSDAIGRVDLHFATDVVYGTLIVERDLEESDLANLIETIDQELVMTADVPRDDFMVSVYRGKDLGFYSDAYFGEEEEEGDDGHI